MVSQAGWMAHLVEENVEDAADEREWQRCGEQGEEPAARVHGRVKRMSSKVAMQVGQKLLQDVVQLKHAQTEMVHVGLVDLSQIVLLHDLNEYGKGLLFWYVLDEQEAADEGAALTVAHFGIMNGIGLHHVEQALLATLVAKELVVRIGAVNVASNDLLARRLLLDVVLELLFGVGEIGAAQVLPSERTQVEWNALSNVLFELGGLLF